MGDGGSNIVEQVTAHGNRVKERLSSVKNIIAVMSGKGGVGKSSFTVNLASAMVQSGFSVGILDGDINGPSISKMSGVRNQKLQESIGGLQPAISASNIKVMSMDLFLEDDAAPVLWDSPTQNDAYTWRGMMESAALREFLSDTEWGTLDFLFIDLPPGTDKLPNLMDLLPQLTGIIVITIPSEVSQFIVGKSITMAKRYLQTPIIGIVENMSTHVCAHCGAEEELFPSGSVESLAGKYQVPFLGKIPFDVKIASSADHGYEYMEQNPTQKAAIAIREIALKVLAFVE